MKKNNNSRDQASICVISAVILLFVALCLMRSSQLESLYPLLGGTSENEYILYPRYDPYSYPNLTNLPNNSSFTDLQVRYEYFGPIMEQMNPFCFEKFPLFIEFGSHHKTGYRFSRDLVNSLLQFCKIGEGYPSYYDTSIKYFKSHAHWPNEFPNVDYFNKYYKKDPIILLHFIRSPLNAIISGFKYHTGCTQEGWLSCPIFSSHCGFGNIKWRNTTNRDPVAALNSHNRQSRRLIKFKLSNEQGRGSLHNNILALHDRKQRKTKSHIRYRTYHGSGRVFGLSRHRYGHETIQARKLRLQKSWEHRMNPSQYKYNANKYEKYSIVEYSDEHLIKYVKECFVRNPQLIKYQTLEDIHSKKLSVCQLYNANGKEKNLGFDNTHRLYFEFVRFTNCEYDEIVESYKRIENYKYGFNFRMEDYTSSSANFDKFIKNLAINAFRWDDFSFTKKEYYGFINAIREHDLNRWPSSHKEFNSHVTQSDAKTKRNTIKGLLTYTYYNDDGIAIIVCEKIKKMTLDLDYKWPKEYKQYC